ncbi:FAD-dependent oxidoreductase [Spongiibacter sp. KMU-166]|uniref:FAD-dependent oxidoreductase n=1 Tax=Spongiibacter thalassae TaxID=2721624 RepID=A0ABX1G9Q7_9GAMM|nr:FAD-dependent oxidoreductase [Spongiibacter thalassae]NKI15883.1 FAD-dependent oxidoreductase [Spongiibacter thalassae]
MSGQKVVIVGGGHAGIELAKRLDPTADVTLVDGKDSFVHTPAAIRAVTDSSLLDKLIIPYKNLLKRGQFVQGWAERIDPDGVVLSDGRKLKSTVTVVATGSSYAAPFKHTPAGLDEFRAISRQAASSLASAKTVAIVGAGPVGAELAGEIAHAYPEKEVHLITDEASLYPMYKPGFGKKLETDFADLGVHLHTGKLVENLQSLKEPYSGTLQLPGGETIDADIVFPAIGAKPQAELLLAVDDVQTAPDGRVMHDGWMRPSKSHPSLFAFGDVLASGDAMTIVSIARQAPCLEKIIKAVLAGKPVESQKPYEGWPLAPILLPLGPKRGASMLPVGKDGMAVGHFLTSRMKGKDLFISKYRKLLGQS